MTIFLGFQDAIAALFDHLGMVASQLMPGGSSSFIVQDFAVIMIVAVCWRLLTS